MASERRLAAILAADVAGYSRLMGADEEGTLAALLAHRRDLIDPKIAEHRGRIVKTTGDGVLVEFVSVVDAVRCAAEIQRDMYERNVAVPDDKRIEFRVGINLGDIIADGDDIYGDGVNVAARLEALAAPGGICVSGVVHDQVQGKLPLSFADRGAQSLKNIARPVSVFELRPDAKLDQASVALVLPDKPSIAVLPFQNMSGDPEQEYFADGIAEDIITALARVRQLFVIARNTTFTYKAKPVDVQAIARELSVRYVLEGSVRKAASRVRITAQLIEGGTRNHLWAERYDRELVDVFAIQDEITQTVVGAIGPELGRAEQERARLKPPNSLDAWDLYQRGLWHFWHFSPPEIESAMRCFQESIRIDPMFSPAFSALSYAHVTRFTRGLGASQREEIDAAFETAKRAAALDNDDALAHWSLGVVNQHRKNHAVALDELAQAMELNPSFASTYSQYGLVLVATGRGQEALPYFDRADRISPRDPLRWLVFFGRGAAHYLLGHFDEAETWGRKSVAAASLHVWSHAILVAALAKADQGEAAKLARDDLLKVKKDFTLAFVRATAPFDQERLALLIDGLRKADIPERAEDAAPLRLPDKPSIAVLPFQNMSGDSEQEYFADGMAEDIITALSRCRWFFVIARNSSFTYKGKAVDVRTVGHELGVRYVLEGSVRKSVRQLRITAQLVEAATGNHLWAERYDGTVEDVFDLQDRITEGIVGAIEPSVRKAEIELARRKRPDSLDAYDLILRALAVGDKWFQREDIAKALELVERALTIDSNYALAHSLAARCEVLLHGVTAMHGATRERTMAHVRAVLACDSDDAAALAFAGFTLGNYGDDPTRARNAIDQALAINPNCAEALMYSAALHSYTDRLDLAEDHAQRSLRLSPFDPARPMAYTALSRSNFLRGRFDAATEAARQSILANPRFPPAYVWLAASQVRLGQVADARETAGRLREIDPNFRYGNWVGIAKSPPTHKEAVTLALREAGFPE